MIQFRSMCKYFTLHGCSKSCAQWHEGHEPGLCTALRWPLAGGQLHVRYIWQMGLILTVEQA